MKKIVTLTIAVLGLLAFSAGTSAQETKTHPTLVVNRSGNVTLQYHPLQNYVGKGKPTLLYFWISQDDACREEALFLQSLHRQYADKGLVVLGVPIDGEIDPTTEAVRELKLTYPHLFDMDDEIFDRYGVDGIPYTVLLAPDGEVIASDLHGEALEKAARELIGLP